MKCIHEQSWADIYAEAEKMEVSLCMKLIFQQNWNWGLYIHAATHIQVFKRYIFDYQINKLRMNKELGQMVCRATIF